MCQLGQTIPKVGFTFMARKPLMDEITKSLELDPLEEQHIRNPLSA
jgi:hypothetical protein